ncbi:hypothetical protein B9Z55_029007 [Caenorhabditis nigoni]|uniref:Uncharacterized protein n=1 Tax=Caenorhabditis nigoni TaxID=1611254 RepID=A0A2G5S9G4_9PELO|nr:hypothetical protein B9Z55_029005 [Caenorhabditis nigoni]PIC11561.1 hypothetical protein B9Z55_029007 [Caenorhabditis nigoni]
MSYIPPLNQTLVHNTFGNIGNEAGEPLSLDDQTSIDQAHHTCTTVVPEHGHLRRFSIRAREYLYRDSKAKPIDYALTDELSGTPPPGNVDESL